MAEKERYQNPVTGDDVHLRLFTYNSNNLADLASIDKIEIYYLDPQERSANNPDGRRLVQTFSESDVTLEATGTYMLPVTLESPLYVIGEYLDVWTVYAVEAEPVQTIEQRFEVYPQLWYTTPSPIVYDFAFHFQPNKLRQGSKQFLIIEIVPNVPRSSDLERYYQNLAIVSDLKVSIEQICGDCTPQEADLRLIVDEVSVDYREKRFGYYKLDTEDMDCGLYNIWFKLEFGGNTYLSDKMQLMIYQ